MTKLSSTRAHPFGWKILARLDNDYSYIQRRSKTERSKSTGDILVVYVIESKLGSLGSSSNASAHSATD